MGQLRAKLNEITDASASNVYVVMAAPGTYKPGTDSTQSFFLKNQVALVGGVEEGGSGGGNPTIFSGDANDIVTGNPNLVATLADNGGEILTHAINSGAAVNKGVQVVKNSSDYYYYIAEDASWFSLNNGVRGFIGPPADAVDLTDTDARGYGRVGIPDIGAYEYGATP